MSLLEVNGLSKVYGEKRALNDFSFSVQEGEIVALIGKNGAGKTTLMNLISGIIAPTGGDIRYRGKDLLRDKALLSEFGILITAVFFDYLNTYENLKSLLIASGVSDRAVINKTTDEVLNLVGLSTQKKKRVKSFSMGMKQRLGFAQTLLTKNSFLILDEPFVGMDPLGKVMMKEVIQHKAHQEGVGILFSSHDLTDVEEICDRVVMIAEGEKTYDGIFEFNTRYEISTAGHMKDDSLHRLASPDAGLEIYSDKVVIRDKALLDEAIRILSNSGVTITDLAVSESSLYEFFTKEAV